VEYIIKTACLRAELIEEENVVRSLRLATAIFVGNLHALLTPRASMWMGNVNIIEKDRMKMAHVFRKRKVADACR